MQPTDFQPDPILILAPPRPTPRQPHADLGTVWEDAYQAARAAPDLDAAAIHYDIASQAEGAMAALPPSLSAARLSLRAAVRIMDDEAEEPSYAPLLRAALRQIEGADATPATPHPAA